MTKQMDLESYDMDNVFKLGIVQETLWLDAAKFGLDLFVLSFKSMFNISVVQVPVSIFDFKGLVVDEMLAPLDVDTVFMPFDLPMFYHNGMPCKCRFSSVAQASSTFIVTRAPTAATTSTINFCYIESYVIGLILGMWVSLAVCMTLSVKVIDGYMRRKTFSELSLYYIWNIILLFFYEPLSFVSKHASWRLAFAVWLFATSIFYVELTSHMKSNLAETTYKTIDSVESLLKYQSTYIMVPLNFMEERFILMKASVDKIYEKLKNIVFFLDSNRPSILEFILGHPILENVLIDGHALIISDFNYKIAISEKFRHAPELSIFNYIGKFYYSSPLQKTYSVFPISFNKTGPFLIEKSNIMLSWVSEVELGFGITRMYNFLYNTMQWKEPPNAFAQIDVKSTQSLFLLYAIGNLLAISLLILELITKHVGYYIKKNKK